MRLALLLLVAAAGGTVIAVVVADEIAERRELRRLWRLPARV